MDPEWVIMDPEWVVMDPERAVMDTDWSLGFQHFLMDSKTSLLFQMES